MADITYFDFDRSNLSEEDQKVVDSLIEAGKVIHKIWQKQVGEDGGNLAVYPADATKEELLEASKTNPEILDGFTVVQRDGDGFKTIPYHEMYAEDLARYFEFLKEASEHTDEEPLKEYISKVIEACKEGDYEAALAAFLMNPNTRVEFLGGPMEAYEDQLLGRKLTFQYNLRILKDDATDEVINMVDIMKNIKLPQPSTSLGSNLQPSNINIRLDNVLMFAGRQAGLLISSTNLPNESELVEKYGTKVVVYTTSMNQKFDKRHVPLLPYFKDQDLNKKIDSMKVAMFRLIALHEITEASVKFIDMESRMGGMYAPLRELNADLVGLDSAKYLLLNGAISLEEFKEIISAFFIFAIDVANTYEKSGSLIDYAKGFAVAFNFFVSNGSLSFTNGYLTVDFPKISRDLEGLSNVTMNILENGDEADAETLFSEYGDFAIFDEIPKVEVDD